MVARWRRSDDNLPDQGRHLAWPIGSSLPSMGIRNTDRSEGAATDHRDAPARRPGRLERIRTSVQSANVEGDSMSSKWAVDRLDDREKRFSFAAAGGSILFGVIIYLSETNNPHFRLAKNQLTPQTILWIGIVSGLLLLVATIVGRRAPVGFLAFFTGMAYLGSFPFLGLPFFLVGGWLIYRSYKFQREKATEARETGSPRSRAAAAPGRSRRSPGKAGASSSRQAKAEANKRYTPPKPVSAARAARTTKAPAAKPADAKSSRKGRKTTAKGG